MTLNQALQQLAQGYAAMLECHLNGPFSTKWLHDNYRLWTPSWRWCTALVRQIRDWPTQSDVGLCLSCFSCRPLFYFGTPPPKFKSNTWVVFSPQRLDWMQPNWTMWHQHQSDNPRVCTHSCWLAPLLKGSASSRVIARVHVTLHGQQHSVGECRGRISCPRPATLLVPSALSSSR